MNLITEISKSFNLHAAEYQKAAIVQKEIGERLVERLDYLNMTPRYILDLGCGPGYFSKLLKKRYPNAQIIGVDLALMMLHCAHHQQSIFKKWNLVQADMLRMPFSSGMFDLVFANQVIHWGSSLQAVMQEINRVMNINGCFMFSTLGPDTFRELRHSWSKVHAYAHTNDFADMHDLGDILLSEQFVDPVVDMEMLTVHYDSLPQLLKALKAQGVRNINPERNQGLTGRKAFQAFEEAIQQFRTEEGQFPLTYEVVYGHAWKGAIHRTSSGGTEAFISVSQLKQWRKS
jgi:malonyl-CoA O-methyltransferase